MAASIRLRRLAPSATALALAVGGSYLSLRDPSVSSSDRGSVPALDAIRRKISDPFAVVPARAVQESALIGSGSANPLDILVIGGGATGCGVALDAVTRGLRVGLVEREDFSSGTSSRSTKLIHGVGNVNEARRIFVQMEENGCVPSSVTYDVVIRGLCNARRLDEALATKNSMFDKRLIPEFNTYATLINGFCAVESYYILGP